MMKLRQKLRDRDDSGAALVIALLFVTVIAVAIAAVLAYADANVRATEAMRRQASTVAAADAAAEVAINHLRNSSYSGDSGTCFDSSNTWTLNNFHPAGRGEVDSARVTCEQDTTTSQAATTGNPAGYALLALQTNSAVEDAIYMKPNGSGTGVRVAGDVGSASNVNMFHGELIVAGSLSAKTCTGTITVTGTRTCGPSAPVLTDPDYAAPPVPTAAGTISPCATKRTFTPGVYSNLNQLNNAYSNCGTATVFDFRPGIYYFAFNGEWLINKGTTVAGSTSPLGNTAPTIPGACPSPLLTNTSSGVIFVFGAQSRLRVTRNATVEICGRRPPSGSSDPSIVFYGLKNSLGTGSLSVPAQSGCVTNTGGGPKCAVLTTDNQSDDVRLYLQGHVYLPRARVELDVRGDSDQFLNGGVTVRSISLFSPASSTIPTPLSSGPIQEAKPGRTVLLLTVYVCPEAGTCPDGSGKVALRVKVGLADPPSGVEEGKRGVTIYSWSVQR